MILRKIYYTLFLMLAAATPAIAVPLTEDITSEIPEITLEDIDGYTKVPNVAQYKGADWSQVVGIAKDVSVEEAKKIADFYPEVTFFFYMKGHRMVLENNDGTYRVFIQGDAVFFSGEPAWGSAPGFSDGYIKK